MTIDNTKHLTEILDDLKKFGTVTVDEDMVIICVLLILLLITVTYKQNHKKLMIAYWQDILIIYNAKGTQLIQIPAYYLKQAIIKPNKLIIPYHQETWVIQINKHDNLKEVEEMLTYFQLL